MGRVGPMELLLILAVFGMAVLAVIGVVLGLALAGRRRRGRRRHGGVGVEHQRPGVVERQVLVQRCRFCQKLTPVDLSACAECGAKL